MDNVVPSPDRIQFDRARESAEERLGRIVYETKLLDTAVASVAAGRVVSEEQVVAWIDSLDTDHELPSPRSGR